MIFWCIGSGFWQHKTVIDEQQQEETSVVQTQMQRVRELAQVSHLTRELAVLLVHRVVVGTKDPLTGEQKITIEWNF